jgi:hypothetical protein
MARKTAQPKADAPDATPIADDALTLDAVTTNATADDSLVEVAYHDGSTFTFDLLYAGRRIAFIDGVARVPQALADDLRAKGYVN